MNQDWIDATIENLEQEGEGVLLGLCSILGVLHHAQFIRVEDRNGLQTPTDDPYGDYEKLQHLHDGRYRTVKVPGYEGDWVCVIHPAAD